MTSHDLGQWVAIGTGGLLGSLSIWRLIPLLLQRIEFHARLDERLKLHEKRIDALERR